MKKKRRGRPKLPQDQQLSASVHVRLTARQLIEAETLARQAGKPLGRYLRDAGLAPLNPKENA